MSRRGGGKKTVYKNVAEVLPKAEEPKAVQPRKDAPKAVWTGNTVAKLEAAQQGLDEEDLLLDSYLESIARQRKHTPKDGACLFRAVAEHVYHTQALHDRVRKECVDHLAANHKEYAAFACVNGKPYDTYLLNMRQVDTWGGEIELQALASLYQANIVIYQSGQPQVLNIGKQEYPKTYELCFSHGNHYDVVFSKNNMDALRSSQQVVYNIIDSAVDAAKKGADKPSTSSSSSSQGEYNYRNVELECWKKELEQRSVEDELIAQTLELNEGENGFGTPYRKEEEGEFQSVPSRRRGRGAKPAPGDTPTQQRDSKTGAKGGSGKSTPKLEQALASIRKQEHQERKAIADRTNFPALKAGPKSAEPASKPKPARPGNAGPSMADSLVRKVLDAQPPAPIPTNPEGETASEEVEEVSQAIEKGGAKAEEGKQNKGQAKGKNKPEGAGDVKGGADKKDNAKSRNGQRSGQRDKDNKGGGVSKGTGQGGGAGASGNNSNGKGNRQKREGDGEKGQQKRGPRDERKKDHGEQKSPKPGPTATAQATAASAPKPEDVQQPAQQQVARPGMAPAKWGAAAIDWNKHFAKPKPAAVVTQPQQAQDQKPAEAETASATNVPAKSGDSTPTESTPAPSAVAEKPAAPAGGKLWTAVVAKPKTEQAPASPTQGGASSASPASPSQSTTPAKPVQVEEKPSQASHPKTPTNETAAASAEHTAPAAHQSPTVSTSPEKQHATKSDAAHYKLASSPSISNAKPDAQPKESHGEAEGNKAPFNFGSFRNGHAHSHSADTPERQRRESFHEYKGLEAAAQPGETIVFYEELVIDESELADAKLMGISFGTWGPNQAEQGASAAENVIQFGGIKQASFAFVPSSPHMADMEKEESTDDYDQVPEQHAHPTEEDETEQETPSAEEESHEHEEHEEAGEQQEGEHEGEGEEEEGAGPSIEEMLHKSYQKQIQQQQQQQQMHHQAYARQHGHPQYPQHQLPPYMHQGQAPGMVLLDEDGAPVYPQYFDINQFQMGHQLHGHPHQLHYQQAVYPSHGKGQPGGDYHIPQQHGGPTGGATHTKHSPGQARKGQQQSSTGSPGGGGRKAGPQQGGAQRRSHRGPHQHQTHHNQHQHGYPAQYIPQATTYYPAYHGYPAAIYPSMVGGYQAQPGAPAAAGYEYPYYQYDVQGVAGYPAHAQAYPSYDASGGAYQPAYEYGYEGYDAAQHQPQHQPQHHAGQGHVHHQPAGHDQEGHAESDV